MIVSASSRTDVPAFYTEWFMNRLRAGFFDVRNPLYEHSVSRIFVEDIDAFMFCTKNPIPLLPHLEEIDKPILLDVTITPYHREIEPFVPDKTEVIEAVRQASRILGARQVAVRYDPIFVSERYTVDYHLRAFEKLCSLLEGFVDYITVSFLDEYKNTLKNKAAIGWKELTEKDLKKLGEGLARSSAAHHVPVFTCHENGILKEYGIPEGECFSWQKAYEMTGKIYGDWKARSCGCVQMADIGVYNSCPHFCRYCYANYDEKRIRANQKNHDPNSSLLIGHLSGMDQVKRRKSDATRRSAHHGRKRKKI